MRLAVIRHAIAEDAAEWAETQRSDDLRPLTERGRERMHRAARGLRVVLPVIDRLVTSPLVRARQTADIIRDVYDGLDIEVSDLMSPGSTPSALGEWLRTLPTQETVAVVGHEPGVSQIVTWFLAGAQSPFLRLKKGAVCMIDFPTKIDGGRGQLVWFARPGHLRGIGDNT